MDEDRLDRYAEAAWNLRCERSAAARERPSGIVPWGERAGFLRKIDKDVAALIAGMAVIDAGIDLAACHAEIMGLRAQLAAVRDNLPAVLRALTIAAGETTYESEARPYRVARQALGSGREGE